jgi:cell division protein FtsW
MIVALMLVPVIGANINGAKRWEAGHPALRIPETGFAICLAWMLSWKCATAAAGDPPVDGPMGLVAMLLMAQPDLARPCCSAGVVCHAAVGPAAAAYRPGRRAWRVVVALAYMFYPNATHRIDDVPFGRRGPIRSGGSGHAHAGGGRLDRHRAWLGARKNALPEAHTDYIFLGDRRGIRAADVRGGGGALLRHRGARADAPGGRGRPVHRAGGHRPGRAIGGQAFINILVNLQLFPSKGMTLPLISYGGSSTIALCSGWAFARHHAPQPLSDA